VIRGTGFADVLPEGESQLLGLVARLYRLPAPPSPDQFQAIAEAWKPFRTWAAVLVRAVAQRLFDAEPGRFPAPE
jgi:DNA-3-methyladenine glycosylase II